MRRFWRLSAAIITAILVCPALGQSPVGSDFTYQGQLKQADAPATGSYAMFFRLYDDAAGGNLVSATRSEAVSVADGLFTVPVDFGPLGVFDGNRRWLEVVVEGVALAPRQELTATPHATYSQNAGLAQSAVTVPWSGITGVPENVSDAFSPWVIGGSLAGWGTNTSGQTNVPSGAFTAVAAGYFHSLAIRADGTLAGWGSNTQGEIDVPPGQFAAVAAGYYYSLAMRPDGTLFAWGQNAYGQCNVPPDTFTAIAAGGAHGVAIHPDGTLTAWGNNTFDQLNVPSGTFIAIAAGYAHSLAIRTDGTLVGWGRNSDGQTNVPSGAFIAIAAGNQHSLAIRSNGTLVGWGSNDYGQINVPPGTFTAVSAGDIHGLAIRSAGTLAAWGNNNEGQTVVPSGTFSAVSAGGFFSLAIRPGVTFSGGDITVTITNIAAASLTVANNIGIGTPTVHSNFRVQSAGGSGAWKGGVAAGGSAANVALGELGGVAQLGGHNANLTAWADLAINSGGGNVGIGTTTPAQKLHVNGSIQASRGVLTCSDERFKTHIAPLDGALQIVEKLRPVRFDWRAIEFPDRQFPRERQIGFIAQEVRQIAPQFVQEGADGYLSVDYGRLTPVLVDAMKELQEQVQSAHGTAGARVAALEAENAELKARLEKLERLVGQPSK